MGSSPWNSRSEFSCINYASMHECNHHLTALILFFSSKNSRFYQLKVHRKWWPKYITQVTINRIQVWNCVSQFRKSLHSAKRKKKLEMAISLEYIVSLHICVCKRGHIAKLYERITFSMALSDVPCMAPYCPLRCGWFLTKLRLLFSLKNFHASCFP